MGIKHFLMFKISTINSIVQLNKVCCEQLSRPVAVDLGGFILDRFQARPFRASDQQNIKLGSSG